VSGEKGVGGGVGPTRSCGQSDRGSTHPASPSLSVPPADVAESIGRELLVYGRRLPKAELFARIDAVSADTVRAVADRFIFDQDMAVAAVGDAQFMPDYNWFRRRSYWLRF
jgi:hypothetical protein